MGKNVENEGAMIATSSQGFEKSEDQRFEKAEVQGS